MYRLLFGPMFSSVALRFCSGTTSSSSEYMERDVVVERKRVDRALLNRNDSWDGSDSVSSGSSLASMCSDHIEDTVADESPASSMVSNASITMAPTATCGIGMSLYRNHFGEYFVDRVSGACDLCGVFNRGDQLVALDGVLISGVSSRTIGRKMRGAHGSSLHVTIKCCKQTPGGLDCSSADSDGCSDASYTTFVVRMPASASADTVVFMGVGLVLKRMAQAGSVSMACYVLTVREGSPAADAGVRTGDALTTVDGIAVGSRSASAIVRLLQGPANTEVELMFIRYNASEQAALIASHPVSSDFKLRVQRRSLTSPDMCLDFCVKNHPARSHHIAAAPGALPANSSPTSSLSSASVRMRGGSLPSRQQGVGFGMNLKRDADGAFHVRRLDVGGPSAASARIDVGDECLAIDGVSLKGKSYSTLSRLVLGPPNSTVELQMRGPRGGAIKKILLNRRSHAPTIPEEDEEYARSSSRGTPEASSVSVDNRVGIGATFRKGRNGVFEVAWCAAAVGLRSCFSAWQVEQLDLGGAAEVSGGTTVMCFVCCNCVVCHTRCLFICRGPRGRCNRRGTCSHLFSGSIL